MANAETRIAILATLLMMTLAVPSDAQTRSVIGQAGILGEWELTATLTQETEGGRWKRPSEPEARRFLQRGRAGRKDGRIATEHVRASERGHRDATDRRGGLYIPRTAHGWLRRDHELSGPARRTNDAVDPVIQTRAPAFIGGL